MKQEQKISNGVNLDKTLTTLITILVLLALVLPLSKLITKKRVIIIGNSSNSLANYEPRRITNNPLGARVLVIPNENENNRINAFFLGIPGKGNSAPNLTDTLMVMSINQTSKQGFLLSIPRDLVVKIPNTNFYTKINALYQQKGIEVVQSVLKEITGLDFDYNITIDLQGVKKIIDQVGGIDISVEENIYDPAFPGPNNSYQLFTLKKGQQHLNGETALRYIRTRHEPTGDFARMSRQQKVLIALKEQISSLHPIQDLDVVLNIWETLKNNFQTNLSLYNIKSLWETIGDINLEKTEFKVLDPTTGLVVADHMILGSAKAYILRPKKGLNDYTEIQEYIGNLAK